MFDIFKSFGDLPDIPREQEMNEITDTERLDFLIKKLVRVLSTGTSIEKQYHFTLGPKVFIGNTPREAIDAAIKAQKEQE